MQKPPTRTPEFQQFVDATGIDWESDLDEVAIALHRMPDPDGPNGPVAYSMVTGRQTHRQASSTPGSNPTPPRAEIYDGHTIYNIPSQARTVRVNANRLRHARHLSNTPTPEADPRHCRSPSHRRTAFLRIVPVGPALPRCSIAFARLGPRPNRACRFLRAEPIQHLRLLAAPRGRLDHRRQRHAGALAEDRLAPPAQG